MCQYFASRLRHYEFPAYRPDREIVLKRITVGLIEFGVDDRGDNSMRPFWNKVRAGRVQRDQWSFRNLGRGLLTSILNLKP